MEKQKAQSLLRQMLGSSAEFRHGQWEAIDAVANKCGRLLVVQRTGWGKSVVYFLATRILRDLGAGPTLLISPLLSLMRNQVLAAERIGIRARTIHSENVEEWQSTEAALRENQCDVLMISPERLGNTDFLQRLLPMIQGQIGLFVVDEAHCISDWGHDFRPDYRRIVRLLRLMPAHVPIVCTTATANDRVVQDVRAQIPDLQLSRGPLTRASLRLFNIHLADQAERLAWLAHFVPQLPRSGIIYTLTIQDARRVAEFLQRQKVTALPYHADLETAQRVQAEQMLLNNEVKVLAATVALGMGFDKPDLGFVIHFQRPGSVVAYYQQVGRAGRAVDEAFGILLSGREDDEITDYFIQTAFPPAETMEAVLRILERTTGMTVEEIGAVLNCRRGVAEKALKLLEVDGAVEHRKTFYSRTPNSWTPNVMRAEQVTALRRGEVEQMRRYVEHTGCLMEFLAQALDDPSPSKCGKCMNCHGQTHRQSPPPALVRSAVEFLHGDAIVLSPRTRWPKAVLAELPAGIGTTQQGERSTIIPPAARAREGRALCLWGDAGWGREVADGKYNSGRFSKALVEAAATLIRERWKPQPQPAWVAAVPSRRRPELVHDFAQRLAVQLQLPFLTVVQQLRDTRPQKQMENSVTQLRNLLGAFAIKGDVPHGPVLLVDDMTDSGWTMTLLAVILQANGSGPVHPFALAKSSPRDS